MSIWNYDTIPEQINAELCKMQKCIFCNINLKQATVNRRQNEPNVLEGERLEIRHCPQCGWWSGAYQIKGRADIIESSVTTKGAYGILRQLDLKDVTLPINEVRDFLTVKYNSIKTIHPRLMEEVVGSVFKDLGYKTHVTNYSGDNGVDVILYDSNSRLIGVQVKRFKNSIKANQIRELTGALLLGGFTKGVFVTTSDFQKGAVRTAEASQRKGIPIELMDYQRFFDALKLTQLTVNREDISWDSYNLDKFKIIDHYTHMETYYLK